MSATAMEKGDTGGMPVQVQRGKYPVQEIQDDRATWFCDESLTGKPET